jgi:hypothetical protein
MVAGFMNLALNECFKCIRTVMGFESWGVFLLVYLQM